METHDQLLQAIANNSREDVEALRVRHHLNKAELFDRYCNAIHLAISRNHVSMLTYFRETWQVKPSDLSLFDKSSLLATAVGSNSIDCIFELRHHWTINEFGRQDFLDLGLAVYTAAQSNNLKALQTVRNIFDKCRANDARHGDNYAINYAARHDMVDMCEELIEHWGIGPKDVFQPFLSHNAFLQAVKHGHVDVLQKFYYMLNIESSYVRGKHNRAILIAAEFGQAEVLRCLQKTWNLTTKDARKDNNIALKTASKNGHAKALAVLRTDFGLTADDARDNDNEALRLAILGGHLDVIRELRNWGLTRADLSVRGFSVLATLFGDEVDPERFAELVNEFGAWDTKVLNDVIEFSLKACEDYSSELFREWQLTHVCPEFNNKFIFTPEEYSLAEAQSGLSRDYMPTDCAICLGRLLTKLDHDAKVPLADDATISVTGCGHVFHENCLGTWRKTNTDCPNCRGSCLAAAKNCLTRRVRKHTALAKLYQSLKDLITERRALARSL